MSHRHAPLVAAAHRMKYPVNQPSTSPTARPRPAISGRATEREIRFGQSDALHRMAEDLRFDVCVRYGCVHDGIPFDDAGVDLYLGMAKVFDEVAECVRPEIP